MRVRQRRVGEEFSPSKVKTEAVDEVGAKRVNHDEATARLGGWRGRNGGSASSAFVV